MSLAFHFIDEIYYPMTFLTTSAYTETTVTEVLQRAYQSQSNLNLLNSNK
jgi:hypothetical protein